MPKRSAANVHDNVNAAEKELCHLPLDWEGGSDPKAQVEIFLVTAARLANDREGSADAAKVDDDLPPLVDPASIGKADFRKAIQDSVKNPIYDRSRGGRPPSHQLEIDVYVGVKEGPRQEFLIRKKILLRLWLNATSWSERRC